MSAMPAGWTEPSDNPRMGASPVQAQRRAERRAELKLARRAQRWWAMLACAMLLGAFGLTVGILDVLH